MMNDVILNKTEVIERCVERIHEVYGGNSENLTNFTKQDSIILNIQRACEASIDLAMFVVSKRKLGVPKSRHTAFQLLQEAKLMDTYLAESLIHIIRFLATAVHDYPTLNPDILETFLEQYIGDFKSFAKVILQLDI